MKGEIQALLGVQITLISVWVLAYSIPSQSANGLAVSIVLLLVGTGIVAAAVNNLGPIS